MSSKAKPNGSNNSKKRRRAQAGKLVTVHGSEGDGFTSKSYPTRRNPAKTKKSANDLMLDAWKYSYETREGRLTKP